MNIDLELREILDKVLVDSMEIKNLEALLITWKGLRSEGNLVSFKDFVFGNINSSLLNSYSTYHGKNVSDLTNEEREELDQLIFHRIYGLESIIEKYSSKISTMN